MLVGSFELCIEPGIPRTKSQYISASVALILTIHIYPLFCDSANYMEVAILNCWTKPLMHRHDICLNLLL